MKNLMLVAAAALFLSPAAFAKGKGTGTAQSHHCEVGGAEVTKTKKECTKAHGTWAKGAPGGAAAKAPPAAAPAAADAAAPAAAPKK